MDNNLYMESLKEDWISFDLKKLENTDVLWWTGSVNLTAVQKSEISKKVLESHAYAIEECKIFQGSKFSVDHKLVGVAERYGGAGTGKNGGGSRCVTYEALDLETNSSYSKKIFQAKGGGANCVVGQHDDKEHNYGGLDARKAIVETIYTNVLGKVLPLGAVRIHGLIFTGYDTAHNGMGTCWGVLMVRDHCIRPAHFLKATAFSPSDGFFKKYPTEIARMRLLFKRISSRIKNHNEFIKFIGQYLKNAANQFAFAKVARITHGTLSPSNISIDGRWLDLPVASFLSGGVNYNIWSQFYTESLEPINYALEILHNYAKFNKIQFNSSVLVKYYTEAFDAYFKTHIAFIFGIPINETNVENLFQEESLIYVSTILDKIIHRDRSIQMQRPVRDPNDPVIAFITGCYISIEDFDAAQVYFEKAHIERDQWKTLANQFSLILDIYINRLNANLSGYDKSQVIFSYFLIALKRCYLSAAFYLPAVDEPVKDLCANRTIDEVAPFIDSFIDFSEWIFDGSIENIILFKHQSLLISYEPNASNYCICLDNINSYYSRYSDFFRRINELDGSLFFAHNFSYSFFFEQLNQIIPILQRKG